jgi:hypothetical protein
MLRMQTEQTADRKAQIAALSVQTAVFTSLTPALNVLAIFYITRL